MVLRSDSSVTVIRPSSGRMILGLGELWEYRELIYFLAWRDVKVRYKQTAIGLAWVILQPLSMIALFSIVFGRFARMPSDGVPYFLFTLAALLPWQYVSRVVTDSSTSLIADQRLVTRVYFPRLVIPLATALAALVDFGVALALVIILFALSGVIPGFPLVFLPLAFLMMIAVALSIGIWLSALTVEYRDVIHAVPFINQLWFFATPIVFPASLFPERWRPILAMNPLTGVVDLFRWCLLGTTPSPSLLIVSVVTTTLLLSTGLMWFRYRERLFVDSLGSTGT